MTHSIHRLLYISVGGCIAFQYLELNLFNKDLGGNLLNNILTENTNTLCADL